MQNIREQLYTNEGLSFLLKLIYQFNDNLTALLNVLALAVVSGQRIFTAQGRLAC